MCRINTRSGYSFFQFIEVYFGTYTRSIIKNWIKHNYKITKTRLQIYFLRQCIRLHLIPKHIQNIANNVPTFTHHRNTTKIDSALMIFRIRILKMELNDAYRVLSIHKTLVFNCSKELSNLLPRNILSSFYIKQDNDLNHFFKLKINKLDNKIKYLINNKKLKITPIKYYVQDLDVPSKTSITNDNKYKNFHKQFEYSFKQFQTEHNKVSTVVITPNDFIHNELPGLKMNEKWFINLSNSHIPKDVTELLQMGEKFTLPTTHNKYLTTLEMIKDVENNTKFDNIVFKSNIRNHTIRMLDKYFNNNYHFNQLDREIINKYKLVSQFLKSNPNIIFMRSDKGNTTVALDKQQYIDNINNMLSDCNTYQKIQKNPVKIIESQVNEIVNRWCNRGYINIGVKNYLRSSDGILPRAYGVPKIHKPNFPFRIIVSSTNSPLHQLATYLHKILYTSIPNSPFYVKDSFHLYNKISDLHLDDQYNICSFDVVSLFTNVPLELAIEGVEKRWKYIRFHTKIDKNEFLIAIRFVLSSTYFTFEGTYYKQTYGTPMGSPLSPIIADIALQDLELRALNMLKYSLPFYFRYVDDVLLAAPKTEIMDILKIFNSFHSRIQFTCELAENNRLSFLDIDIIISDNKIICDWYQKPTWSGRYLNFLSYNPICHKIGVVISLIDRAILLSHPTFHEKNLKLIITILISNNYPIDLIFRTINKRLKFLFSERLNRYGQNKNNETPRFFTVPFVPSITDGMKDIANNDKPVKIAYRNIKQLRCFIKTHKDQIPKFQKKNVVYCISCKNCDCTYVGQTGRQLQTRIKEHKRNVANNKNQISVLAEHSINTGHQFDWDNTKLLDIVPSLSKRLISETIHIKMQNNSLNIMQDTQPLDNTYMPVVNRLKALQ